MTGAVWMRARAELRGRWRSMFSAGVLCGLFGAAALATLAGAERTVNAYPSFLDRQKAHDLLVSDASFFAPIFWSPDFDALAGLPYMEAAVPVTLGGVGGTGEGDLPDGMFITGSADPDYGRSVQRPLVVEGRLPDPARADEISVPYFAASELGRLRVGGVVSVVIGGEKVALTVVGRTVFPDELPPENQF
ncbi:MAG: hypothetical protein ACRDKS_11070, partial [Actinomycetota bacterium]